MRRRYAARSAIWAGSPPFGRSMKRRTQRSVASSGVEANPRQKVDRRALFHRELLGEASPRESSEPDRGSFQAWQLAQLRAFCSPPGEGSRKSRSPRPSGLVNENSQLTGLGCAFGFSGRRAALIASSSRGGRDEAVVSVGDGGGAWRATGAVAGGVPRKVASKRTFATVPSLRKRRAGRGMPYSVKGTSKVPLTWSSRLPDVSV